LRPIEAIRKKEAEFKELGLSEDTPDEELIKAIIEHPALLQRPIVEVGRHAVIARPVEKALKLLNRSLE
jgi:arsenate reductase (glutaredoxin)